MLDGFTNTTDIGLAGTVAETTVVEELVHLPDKPTGVEKQD
jgi:hypothetical protein